MATRSPANNQTKARRKRRKAQETKDEKEAEEEAKKTWAENVKHTIPLLMAVGKKKKDKRTPLLRFRTSSGKSTI